mgnify:CR=1 FL=1
MKRSTTFALLTLALAPQFLFGQSFMTLDKAYGVNGIAKEALPSAYMTSVVDRWRVEADGSAYIIRKGRAADTALLVERLIRSGQPDPLFDNDGITSIHPAVSSASTVLFNNGEVLLGQHRALRYEFHRVGVDGIVSTQPIWQDLETRLSVKPIGVLANGTIPMWISREGGSTPQRLIRILEGVGSNNSVLREKPLSIEPFDFTQGHVFTDASSRILSLFTNSDGRIIVARYLSDGTLDESFGNALGMFVMNLEEGRSANSTSAIQTRDGGYLLACTLSPEMSIFSETVHLIKLTPSGGLDPSWGDRGLVTLNGNQMYTRGLVELPNRDIVFLTHGTTTYSHLYHLRPNGSIVPGTFGEFSMTELLSVGHVIENKWLYGIVYSGAPFSSIGRYILGPDVTSIHNDGSSDARLHVEQIGEEVFVAGVDGNVEVALYTVVGQLITSYTTLASSSNRISIPPGLPRTPLVVTVRQGGDVGSTLFRQ